MTTRKLFILLALSTLLAFPSAAQEGEAAAAREPADLSPEAKALNDYIATIPDTVATVDGEPISKIELLLEAQGAQEQLAQLGDLRRPDAAFFAQTLDQLVAGRLLQKDAKARGLAATPEEVAQRMTAARQQFDSDEAYQAFMAQQGTSEEQLRGEFEREISIRKYVRGVLAPQIDIGSEQARAYYDQNVQRFAVPERVKVRHILVAVPPEADETTRNAAQERARAALERARGGEDFATLAVELSDDESKSRGGELPWLARGQSLPAFEDAAFATPAGELSDLVQTRYGFHVIKAIDRQAPRTQTFDEVEERIVALLREEALREAMRVRVSELEASTDVERHLPPTS